MIKKELTDLLKPLNSNNRIVFIEKGYNEYVYNRIVNADISAQNKELSIWVRSIIVSDHKKYKNCLFYFDNYFIKRLITKKEIDYLIHPLSDNDIVRIVKTYGNQGCYYSVGKTLTELDTGEFAIHFA